MKNISKVFLAVISIFLFSFTAKAPVKNPTVPPYVSALAFLTPGQDYIDVWVRWDANTVLTQDYYADVSVTYHDWCTTWTQTVHCIVHAGNFMSFTDIYTCEVPTIVTYSLVSWGPL